MKHRNPEDRRLDKYKESKHGIKASSLFEDHGKKISQ